MSTTPILGRKSDYTALGTVDHAELNALVADLEWIAGAVVTVDLTGSADVTLSATQYDARVLLLIGVLGASINLILPANRAWILVNGTTGSTYTVTAKTSGGTGIALQQGETALLAGDGVNIVRGQDPRTLSGTNLNTVADANVIGGIPVLHRIDVAAGATGNVDVTLTHKSRVLDVWLVKKSAAGGGAGTIQVKNGATAITDAMSINVADQTVVRAGTIDDAQWEIAAGGTLRVTRTRTASTDEACTVYVSAIRVA